MSSHPVMRTYNGVKFILKNDKKVSTDLMGAVTIPIKSLWGPQTFVGTTILGTFDPTNPHEIVFSYTHGYTAGPIVCKYIEVSPDGEFFIRN